MEITTYNVDKKRVNRYIEYKLDLFANRKMFIDCVDLTLLELSFGKKENKVAIRFFKAVKKALENFVD